MKTEIHKNKKNKLNTMGKKVILIIAVLFTQ